MDQDAINQSLMEAAGLAEPMLVEEVPQEAPVEAEIPQEAATEQPIAVEEPVAEVPQEEIPTESVPDVTVPPSLTPEQIAEIVQKQVSPINEQLSEMNKQPEPEPTEEDLAMQELAKRLGIDAIRKENEELKAWKAQQEQEAQQRAQAEAQQQLQREITDFKTGKPDGAEEVVLKALENLAKQNPQMAAQFDNPVGWDYIYRAEMANSQPVSKPDPIIGTTNNTATPQSDVFERQAKGETLAPVDIGDAILMNLGGR